MTKNDPNAKVLFRIPDEDGSADVETLWAYDLNNDTYKLDNVPFYAYSVSLEDIVYAPYDESESFPVFERIVEKSGNRTVRLVFDTPVEDGDDSDQLLKELVNKGCGYEGASRLYIAINIPQNVDLETIRAYLIQCGVNWEHADPRYSELFPDDE